MNARLSGVRPFLWADESPEHMRALCSGEIIVAPAAPSMPLKVPNGLIHHWIGAAFLPGANLDDVLRAVQDYNRYKDFYKPLVVDSSLDSQESGPDGEQFRFSLVMMNDSLFSRHAIETDWKENYVRLGSNRAYSIARTVSIREIENYKTAAERTLPEGEGSGYLWGMQAISRLEQRDGGVYVELEALALSRDVPSALRWFVDPIIRRVSKSSLTTSLKETRAAVRQNLESLTRSANVR